jgi:2-polyprenyl-3-methyl-5-hydroxy-6-metoxy-1,4-benzoquinol methylase
MNKELDSSYYDKVFETSPKYKKNANEISVYYVLWNFAKEYIIENNIKLVIDIGCGPGHLAQVIQDLDIKYIGIDFSKVAIEQAISRVNKDNFTFINTNAIGFNYNELINGYNNEDILITSFEFLEHVNKDLEVIQSLLPNIKCCFSVPNYDCKGHVRFFKNSTQVKNRYQTVLDIDNIINKKHGENNIIFIIIGKTKI